MASFLHGVETIEIDRGPRPIRGVRTAVVGLVGTAPIFTVDGEMATVNEPVLILSDRDARRRFGPQMEGYTIPQALDAIFDQGSGIAIVVNVFDPEVHRSSQAATEKTFDADDEIALDHPGVMNLVVQDQAETATHEAGTDYTVNAATGVITRLEGGAIAAGATVSVAYDYADPGEITSAEIIGEVDGSGNRTGMQGFLDTYNMMGFFPKILIAPVYGETNAVATEINVMAGHLRAVGLVDAPVGTTFADAIAGRGPDGSINFNYSSDRMVLCYPHLKVYDAEADENRLEPYSQRLAGVICATDAEAGYWTSPSNSEIKGIVGVERRLSAMINDPNTEVNLLNENGIVTVFNSFGSGLRVWGNRSAAWPSVTHPKNFIPIRRVADMLHESVELSMLQFIDRPINQALIDDIRESVNSFIRTLIGRGALIDGKCSYDPAKNEATQIAAGHLVFDIEFMPPTPAERITFESFINIELLNQLGGQ